MTTKIYRQGVYVNCKRKHLCYIEIFTLEIRCLQKVYTP